MFRMWLQKEDDAIAILNMEIMDDDLLGCTFYDVKLCETRLEQRLEQRNTTGMVNSSPSVRSA